MSVLLFSIMSDNNNNNRRQQTFICNVL